jgi:hypothetical protein
MLVLLLLAAAAAAAAPSSSSSSSSFCHSPGDHSYVALPILFTLLLRIDTIYIYCVIFRTIYHTTIIIFD